MIKQTHMIMGMPVTLMTPTSPVATDAFEKTFAFFKRVDEKYSPYKMTSEVSRINQKKIAQSDYSTELREILEIAQKTKIETNGYFDVWHDDVFDPSGIVKGWAIQKASEIMHEYSEDFYIEAGGDIQVSGVNDAQTPWRIGIRNPFDREQNIAVVQLENHAIATSGTAVRGQHIYDPVSHGSLKDIVSLSVIAPKIIDADRIATAAFAMGPNGIQFIEKLHGYEAYMVNKDKRVTMTTGWRKFEVADV